MSKIDYFIFLPCWQIPFIAYTWCLHFVYISLKIIVFNILKSMDTYKVTFFPSFDLYFVDSMFCIWLFGWTLVPISPIKAQQSFMTLSILGTTHSALQSHYDVSCIKCEKIYSRCLPKDLPSMKVLR